MNRKLDAASVPTQERYNKKVCSESQSLQVTAGVGNVFCWVNTALRDEGTPSPRVGMSFSEDTESGLKCQRHGWSRYHPNHRRYLFSSAAQSSNSWPNGRFLARSWGPIKDTQREQIGVLVVELSFLKKLHEQQQWQHLAAEHSVTFGLRTSKVIQPCVRTTNLLTRSRGRICDIWRQSSKKKDKLLFSSVSDPAAQVKHISSVTSSYAALSRCQRWSPVLRPRELPWLASAHVGTVPVRWEGGQGPARFTTPALDLEAAMLWMVARTLPDDPGILHWNQAQGTGVWLHNQILSYCIGLKFHRARI
ncbi:hypothetical protein F2P81_019443 [Scophthalmus maximus]|uniref:Uncharacterized protein n=1 Tax=Scophthalmus maximus TaxID=52904 RepID=A0A6A4RZL9_SCOMX|nr:hypothetical protein F2P81_019443 [Scophthalmus maximus]